MYVSSRVRCQVAVCVGLISRPEESYRVWYDELESIWNEADVAVICYLFICGNIVAQLV